MVFLVDSESENFLSAKLVKKNGWQGKTATILDEGTIETIKKEGEKEKAVINYNVEIEGKEIIYTPNKTNRGIWEEAWGEEREIEGKKTRGLDTSKLPGKQFKITLTKVNLRGSIVDSVLTEPVVLDVKTEKAEGKGATKL